MEGQERQANDGIDQPVFDAIVIGAGATGLMASLEIAITGRKVAIIEATGRTGGRILTVQEGEMPVELGAEFVHGNLPITQMLLKKAGANTYEVQGSIWQYKEGKFEQEDDFIEDYEKLQQKFRQLTTDKSVAAFLAEDLAGDEYGALRISLKNYVEGYYAANIEKASIKALCEELTKGDEEQYRINGGYQTLIGYLEQECRRHGVVFQMAEPVHELCWQNNMVKAITSKGSYSGRKALIAVPMSVLQNECIRFSPALPQVRSAAKQLGFGHVIKLVFCFKNPFWKEAALTNGKDLGDLSFLFSEEAIPTWWTHHPNDNAVLTGWLGGPGAEALQDLSADELKERAFEALRRLFDIDLLQLKQQLAGFHMYNWSTDPYFRGAYSYEVVGGAEHIQIIQQPMDCTLFFAGEGLQHGPEIGTVEGALQSGRKAARLLIQHLSD